MKDFSRRSLLVLFALFGVAQAASWTMFSSPAGAQWKNVAPNLVHGEANFIGAMQFRDGIVWAGANDLWSSTDLGVSWKKSVAFPGNSIRDIAFFDKQNGLVATDDGVFRTSDGGKTWLVAISSGEFWKVAYNGSALVAHALEFGGIIHTTMDGGQSWSSHNVANNGNTRSIAVASDHTIYAQSADPNSASYIGTVMSSTDFGKTWSSGGATMGGDCCTLSVDSCDTKRLYLVNEENNVLSDSTAKLYLSTDGGQSWTTTASHAIYFYSGTMTTTSTAFFAGTVDEALGSFRSTDKGMTWQNIGGPSVFSDTRNIAAINANIILAADTNGSIWRTTNGGGDSVQVVASGTLSLAPKKLFDGDSVECDTVVRIIQILKGGCPSPSVSSISIIGPDSSSYSESVAGDSISVMLLPRAPGAKNASLIANIDNGTSDTIALGGFTGAYQGTVVFSSDSLFEGRTLHCDSLTLPIYLSKTGCHPPPPTQILISGKDSDSFHIADSSADSVSIEWTSQKPGAQEAYLIAVLADGTRDSVALAGFSTTTPLVLSVSPQSLFQADSLYVHCDPSPTDTIHVAANSCIWPNVKSERIIGADSMDYSISNPISSTLGPSDSTIILFTPSDTGLRAAAYELRLDNDTVITIPLGGVGLATRKLSLAAVSMNEKTDTIGGMVAVPIIVDGLARAETIELVLHYPLADLDYVGSFDPTGTKVDIPGEQWPGRSKLRITGAKDSAVAAYARFNVFSDTAYNPQITFDSLDVPTAITPCEYVDPPAAIATIVPMQGCGIQMLSRWVHLGQRPVFGIRPNPTSGAISITSSMDVGDVSIEVYDMLGTERAHFNLSLSNDAPATLSLPLESGLYYVRVISEAGASNVPIIIKR